ncbi:hypothetical protein ACC691_37235, partial [Rhizobium johnstonii]|uniref:hypothetical protein n=1 Tax=Rhizobium johnstonii TaxID=3019933 RepID=UPI003F9CDB4B
VIVGASSTTMVAVDVASTPMITSGDTATFLVGTGSTFTVSTAGGWPSARSIAFTGTLPSGLTFTDNGDGSATISGSARPADAGVHLLSIAPSNGILTGAAQALTIVVNATPLVTA